MRVILTCLGAALASCTAPPPPASNAPIAELEGMVAGAPQRCVLVTQSEGFTAANRNTLLLRKGKALWVNRLQGTCGGFDRWDVIVTEPIGSQH